MALLTQGILHSNDYISIVKLINAWFFYTISDEVIYIYILDG